MPEKFIPLVLLGFGAGALLGVMTGGRFGDRRPFGTAIPAAVLTACVLTATALWASSVPAAVTLVVLLGATAFVLTPILVAQAFHGHQRRTDAGVRAGHGGVQHRERQRVLARRPRAVPASACAVPH